MKFAIEARELHNVFAAASAYNEEAVLKFKDNGILIELQDASRTGAFASMMPESAMETYDVQPGTHLGVRIGKMIDVLPKSDSTATVELDMQGVHKTRTSIDGREYSTPLVDTDDVAQVPESVPSLDMCVKVWNEQSWLLDFVSEASDYVFSGNPGAFWLSAQDGLLYLYSSRDDYEVSERLHWEDFDNYEIDWDEAYNENAKGMDIEYPQERQRIEVALSTDLVSDITLYGDDVRIEFGHCMPLKAVSESENGVKFSWIIPPRYPSESDRGKVPDRVVVDRGV